MNAEELQRFKEDFRDWLTLPNTKRFIQVVAFLKGEHQERANEIIFRNYYKKDLPELAIQQLGKVDGMTAILNFLEECKVITPRIESLFEEVFLTKPLTD